MISNDKISQNPAKFDDMIYNIFKVVSVLNVHKGNIFILAIYEPTQLQPFRGHPFLVQPCVIPCYKIIPIKDSVCAQDNNFSGFNRFLEAFIKNLLINHRLLIHLNGSAKD